MPWKVLMPMFLCSFATRGWMFLVAWCSGICAPLHGARADLWPTINTQLHLSLTSSRTPRIHFLLYGTVPPRITPPERLLRTRCGTSLAGIHILYDRPWKKPNNGSSATGYCPFDLDLAQICVVEHFRCNTVPLGQRASVCHIRSEEARVHRKDWRSRKECSPGGWNIVSSLIIDD